MLLDLLGQRDDGAGPEIRSRTLECVGLTIGRAIVARPQALREDVRQSRAFVQEQADDVLQQVGVAADPGQQVGTGDAALPLHRHRVDGAGRSVE